VALGAITQVRVLGGVIGLAIAQAVLIATLQEKLGKILKPEQLTMLLASTESIRSFTDDQALLTRETYGKASNLQMRIVMGFVGASLVCSLGTWRKNAIEFKDVPGARMAPAEDVELGGLQSPQHNDNTIAKWESSAP
jgi:hypothetical protein